MILHRNGFHYYILIRIRRDIVTSFTLRLEKSNQKSLFEPFHEREQTNSLEHYEKKKTKR